MKLKNIRRVKYSVLNELINTYRNPIEGRLEGCNTRLKKPYKDNPLIELSYHDNAIIKYYPDRVSLHNVKYYTCPSTTKRLYQYFPQQELLHNTSQTLLDYNYTDFQLANYTPTIIDLIDSKVRKEPELVLNKRIGFSSKLSKVPIYEGITFVSEFNEYNSTYMTDVDEKWLYKYYSVKFTDKFNFLRYTLCKLLVNSSISYMIMVNCHKSLFEVRLYNIDSCRRHRKYEEYISKLFNQVFDSLDLYTDVPKLVWGLLNFKDLDTITITKHLQKFKHETNTY